MPQTVGRAVPANRIAATRPGPFGAHSHGAEKRASGSARSLAAAILLAAWPLLAGEGSMDSGREFGYSGGSRVVELMERNEWPTPQGEAPSSSTREQ